MAVLIPLHDFHVGDVPIRVCTALKDGKHVATATTFAEIQRVVACASIAYGLRCKTVLFLNSNDFYLRYKALCHGCGGG